MTDERITALDPTSRLVVTAVDCRKAAEELMRAHLSGPVAGSVLAQALAGVALLGAETSQSEETVTFRLDCPGPIGGFLVEATAAGTLRGYTKTKILNDFDGAARMPSAAKLYGDFGTFEVIRSIPGSILSSGTIAVSSGEPVEGLSAYYAQSLQRRAVWAIAGVAGDEGNVQFARGVMVECPPDGDVAAFSHVAEIVAGKNVTSALRGALISTRKLLKTMGLEHAEIRDTLPLSFACRCSAERAQAMLAALPPSERATLPEKVDITCHMCGRTWTVASREVEA